MEVVDCLQIDRSLTDCVMVSAMEILSSRSIVLSGRSIGPMMGLISSSAISIGIRSYEYAGDFCLSSGANMWYTYSLFWPAEVMRSNPFRYPVFKNAYSPHNL